MRPNEILARVRQRPFVPIRVFLSDGSSYDVTHPETISITHTLVAISFSPTEEDEAAGWAAYCDPIHVVRIEPIEPIGRKNGNSKPRRRPRK